MRVRYIPSMTLFLQCCRKTTEKDFPWHSCDNTYMFFLLYNFKSMIALLSDHCGRVVAKTVFIDFLHTYFPPRWCVWRRENQRTYVRASSDYIQRIGVFSSPKFHVIAAVVVSVVVILPTVLFWQADTNRRYRAARGERRGCRHHNESSSAISCKLKNLCVVAISIPPFGHVKICYYKVIVLH